MSRRIKRLITLVLLNILLLFLRLVLKFVEEVPYHSHRDPIMWEILRMLDKTLESST
jgi:hypothetical protein